MLTGPVGKTKYRNLVSNWKRIWAVAHQVCQGRFPTSVEDLASTFKEELPQVFLEQFLHRLPWVEFISTDDSFGS